MPTVLFVNKQFLTAFSCSFFFSYIYCILGTAAWHQWKSSICNIGFVNYFYGITSIMLDSVMLTCLRSYGFDSNHFISDKRLNYSALCLHTAYLHTDRYHIIHIMNQFIFKDTGWLWETNLKNKYTLNKRNKWWRRRKFTVKDDRCSQYNLSV